MKELKSFLLDGRLEIDNNRAERMMKNFVIGRKDFSILFFRKWCRSISYSL